MIKRLTADQNVEHYPKKASTEFSKGCAVKFTDDGFIEPMDATSQEGVVGFILNEVNSTDDDYAETTDVPVDIPTPKDTLEVDVTGGTLTTAMIGQQFDFDANGNGIDVTSNTIKHVTVVGFISETKAIIKINDLIFFRENIGA